MTKLDKLTTLIPLDELEWSAQQQIYDNLIYDFLIKLVIMPDCHMGYLLPIGGVALLDAVISPEYVGFDQGCGMCCIITNILSKDLNENDKIGIFNKIYNTIPVGVGKERDDMYELIKPFKSASGNKELDNFIHTKQYIQIGTLGSGNHFIEIGENTEGKIVVTIHSGSRRVGYSIAEYYIKISKEVDKDLPKGFLRLDGDLGKAFVEDLNFSLNFALENRKMMMINTLKILGLSYNDISELLQNMINENHNHAIVRDDGVLHRKGATPAEKGVLGVIPGTMKSGVYITKGLGNEEYLSSASHGAGRKYSRNAAKKNISLNEHKEWMKGIIAKVDNNTLDESHGAYKDLNVVINRQTGIVIDVIDYVKPLINIKG